MLKKLLMIEDDPLILKNTLQILRLEGFDVLGAENGIIGLEAVLTYRPDLIISDISMPGLSGLDVLAQVRANPRTAAIPFIFLTAHGHKEDLRQGMEAGADDYLTKPFTVPDLLTAIQARFNRQSVYLEAQERRLNELRGNIIYLLPHELRTPLVSILGYADFLLDMNDNLEAATARKGLERIKMGGERLYRLVENYLLYAQLEVLKSDAAAQAALRAHRVDQPAEIISHRAASQAQRANREADLTLTLVEVPSVHISDDGLKKIVEELLDNAFKFSSVGSPVSLTTQRTDDDYHISVVNQGRGMTAEQIASVGAYMQFQRKLYEQQGSGLGLSLVNGLIDVYGGQVAIASVPNRETTVTVSLHCYTGTD